MIPAAVSNALRQNLYYALGILVMKGVSLLMLPFIAHQLSPELFGQLEVLTSLAALGAILVGLGLLNTLFRYAGSAESPEQCNAVVATIMTINLLLGGVALLAGLLLAPQIAGLLPGGVSSYNVSLAIGIVALDACISIPLGWLRMNDRAALFFALNSGKAIIQALLVVLLLKAGRGLEGVMEAGLVASGLLATCLLVLQLRDTGIALQARLVPGLLVYSVPLVGSGLLGFILTGLDRWILADAVGPAQMALYAVAAKFAMIAALLLQPFLMWWSPRRFQVLKEDQGPLKAARYAAAGCALSLVIAVSVGLAGPVLIRLLLPETYWAAAEYVPWLVLIVAIKDCAELLNLGCYTGNTTGAQLAINLAGSGVGLIGMLVLVPIAGIGGAIAALMAAQLLRLVLYLGISQRMLYLPYPFTALVSLALLAVGLLALGTQMAGLFEQLLMAVIAVLVMVTATGLVSFCVARNSLSTARVG